MIMLYILKFKIFFLTYLVLATLMSILLAVSKCYLIQLRNLHDTPSPSLYLMPCMHLLLNSPL